MFYLAKIAEEDDGAEIAIPLCASLKSALREIETNLEPMHSYMLLSCQELNAIQDLVAFILDDFIGLKIN